MKHCQNSMVRLPVLDGLAAVRLIQEHAVWQQVKVVAISASVLEHERQEYLQAGFDDFIDKPFSFERVCQCLAQQLGVESDYGAAHLRGLRNRHDLEAILQVVQQVQHE